MDSGPHLFRLYYHPLMRAVRFEPLGPTPLLDSRCTFLGLGTGLPVLGVPRFHTVCFDGHAKRTPLLNVHDDV